ncbi:MAG: hypothetical protein OCD02_19435 [Spirochaetaceae bacterium]
MDDLLSFSGNVQKIIVERAQIQKGTFSDKEGKKSFILEANYSTAGELQVINYHDKIENHVYYDGEMICLHVAKLDKTPLYKQDHFYENSLLVKKTRVNEHGHIDDTETYRYNSFNQLIEKKSKSITYEYIYQDDLLIEERWHSDQHINQIIKYVYEGGLLIEVAHYSGDEILGRKIEYKRESHGYISEEIIFSASNLIVSHFRFEYPTIYKNNWLKRVKYTLDAHNKKKMAAEVQYRDFKFYDIPTKKEDFQPKEIKKEHPENYQELEFDNGIYKGEVVDDDMHGTGDFIFNTGTRYKGSFKNNIMEGKGKLTYINGKVYEGTFVNNVLEGPGACKWENGDFYVGEFQGGKMHGRGCYIWENGNRFEGIFENNRRSEQGILYKSSELESSAPPEWVNELFR